MDIQDAIDGYKNYSAAKEQMRSLFEIIVETLLRGEWDDNRYWLEDYIVHDSGTAVSLQYRSDDPDYYCGHGADITVPLSAFESEEAMKSWTNAEFLRRQAEERRQKAEAEATRVELARRKELAALARLKAKYEPST